MSLSTEELIRESQNLAVRIAEAIVQITHISETDKMFLRNRFDEINALLAKRISAYDYFYDNVAELFAEGVEFMDKIQLYNAFKEGFLKLQEKLK